MDNFIKIPFSAENLDRYIIRMSILKAIKWAALEFGQDIIDIGCGKMPYKNYIINNSKVENYTGLDIKSARVYDKNVSPDYYWDGITMPFKSESFESALGTEVLEHCPEPEIVLKETYRVLKPKGTFFFTVPFLWNLHEVPNDEYRYTPFSLERHLKNSGFSEIKIYTTGGWHASMAQMLGLWVRRSPMHSKIRFLLSRLLKPFIKFLINKDKKYPASFKEGQMITGLYGIAKK